MTQNFTEPATSRLFQMDLGGSTLRIHFNDCDPGDSRETIVMLHGSGPGATGWSNFSRNISPFTSEGYRVIFLDCPGWGKSDTIVCTGSRSELNAEALNGLLGHLGLDTVSIIGNSMGGHSAVAFALAHPQKVRKLILMGGGTGGASLFAPMPTEGIKLLQGVYRDPTKENLQKLMNVFVHDPSGLTPELMGARLDNILARRDHLESFLKSTAANPRQFPDVSHRLHEIQLPTLIAWGRDDRFVPFDTGLRLMAGIANAELHLFNKCGHWVQWEQHQKFNQLVLNFLMNG